MPLDVDTANAKVRTWRRDVANARLHGTTMKVPREQLLIEQAALQALPPAYSGKRIVPALPALSSLARPPQWHHFSATPLQHDLSVYDRLLAVR